MDNPHFSSQIVLTGYREKLRFIARVTMGVVLPSLIIMVTQIISLIKNGYEQIVLIFLIAAIISIPIQTILLSSVIDDVQSQREKPSRKTMMLTVLGVMPTSFGAFTCLYKGMWALKDVCFHFSVSGLLLYTMFIILGGKVFNTSQKIENITRAIEKREIVFEY